MLSVARVSGPVTSQIYWPRGGPNCLMSRPAGTIHILLLMSTHILIITVLSWCKALMNSMVHTRI